MSRIRPASRQPSTPPMLRRGLRIALLSPKGPLYRHRGGIFGRGLRYMPLTLPTLAALIPEELEARVFAIDEGISDIDLELEADLIAIAGLYRVSDDIPRHVWRRPIQAYLDDDTLRLDALT